MNLIDGRKIASSILDEITHQVALLSGRKPGLAFLLVGSHPASQAYVRAKKAACARCGIHSVLVECSETVTESELFAQIERLNQNPEIDAILIQLPLPPHLDPLRTLSKIDPAKDVDGFHPLNTGKLLLGDPSAICPCTPRGIQVLLQRSNIEVEGKHVVIVGRSNIVGKPLAALLMQKKRGGNATVTVCHSGSMHLKELTRSADVLVVAAGQKGLIGKEMVRPGSVVIDVGIHRVGEKLVGDVLFDEVAPIASKITPVPGGVGPMTIAMLLQNTLERRLQTKF